VVLGDAPVNWFIVPGKESEGAEVKASVYSYPVRSSFAMVEDFLRATYFSTSLLWKPSMLKTATCEYLFESSTQSADTGSRSVMQRAVAPSASSKRRMLSVSQWSGGTL